MTVIGAWGTASACDLCSIYTATVMPQHKTGPWVAVSEQFTSFNTVRDGDETLDNESNEWLQSSITQLVLGYAVHPRVSFQLNIPLISREFRRVHDGTIERDDEDGLGDVSLVGRFNAYEHVTGHTVLRCDFLAGVKLPSGDSHRLGEELEHHDEDAGGAVDGDGAHEHGTGEEHEDGHGTDADGAGDGTGDEGSHEHSLSGVHGHDLALGSGSVDGMFGLVLFGSWKRAFFDGELQYLVRGDGDFEYTYADELLWSAGPGAFVLLGHRVSAAVEAQLTGESKGKDHLAGERLDDTAITALYLGPRLSATFEDAFHSDLGVEWPLLQNVTSVQIVPDWRLRAAVTWRF